MSEATHLTITSRVDGFRRAGREWSTLAAVVAVAEFTADQIAALKAEPMLTVTPATPEEIAALEPEPGQGSEQEPGQENAPDSEPRLDKLVAVIGGLDPDNESHFTTSGKPEVAALRKASGLDDVTGAERDGAWAAHQGALEQ